MVFTFKIIRFLLIKNTVEPFWVQQYLTWLREIPLLGEMSLVTKGLPSHASGWDLPKRSSARAIK